MGVKTFNLGAVDLIFAGIPISGYADGTVITVARDNPASTSLVGGDGEGARAMSNDRSGTVTCILLQTSASNAALSAIARADEDSGGQFTGTLMVKDGSGTSVASAETAWIEKIPDGEYGREITNRTWIFKTDNLDSFIGGN